MQVSFVQVCLGMDNRESSPGLLNAIQAACELLNVNVTSYGLVTTPMLHWLVSQGMTDAKEVGNYHINFCKAFIDYLALCEESHLAVGSGKREKYRSKLVLDCANGVGAASVLAL